MRTIDSFSGEFEFLSNFYPCQVAFDGMIWKSVEHAYQAAKTDSAGQRTKIYGATSPYRAKKLGSKAKLRQGWDEEKVGVMESLVRDKFSRNPDLGRKLLGTGSAELIEGNTWNDRFWGVAGGRGENNLGKILMRVRSELARPAGGGNGD